MDCQLHREPRQYPQPAGQSGIAILGSSLILSVFEDKGEDTTFSCREQLEKFAGQSGVRISLAASPGVLMSDCSKITKALLERSEGKKPELLIITYSYRDFCDNLQPGEGNSPVSRALEYTRAYSKFRPRVQELLSQNAAEELVKCWQSHERHVRRVAAFLRKELIAMAEKLRTRGLNEAANVHSAPPQAATSISKERDLAVYKTRYKPANLTQFKFQLNSLESILKDSRTAGKPVLLVNMPVTAANSDLIPETLQGKWQDPIVELANKYGAGYKDFDTAGEPSFNDADFFDSVHLNKEGARKFTESLLKWIVTTSQYRKAIQQN